MLQRRIILRGIVEGVGMRPALYRFSVAHGFHGFVRNMGGAVELLWQGEALEMEEAFFDLESAFPPGSRVDHPAAFEDSAPEMLYSCFSILPGPEEDAGSVNRLTPPDLAPCPRCLEEIFSVSGRRASYAFNSCADCGPRASVIESLPYDREATAWKAFPLCPACRKEYEDPSDRRFHVEGISCPVCGPELKLMDRAGNELSPEDPLGAAALLLARGGILAMKGVGGFQLLADPCSESAVRRLRACKKRPEKPLALMGRSVEDVRRYCRLDSLQEEALTSPAAPIVLLEWKRGGAFHEELLAPDNPREAGIMLPASPLHVLLMQRFPGPFLIATSGNREGEPPALEDADAAGMLSDGADAFLTHNRAILHRNDDSLGVSNGGRFQLWRRARGYPLSLPWRVPRSVAAAGALWKNTFAVAGEDFFLVSPHQGGLEDAANAERREAAFRKMLSQLAAPPEVVAVDLHPDYFSTIAGERLARELGAELCRVPHHYAHALAGLLESGERAALALVFDGTGLGPDGRLWGAELLEVSLDQGGRRLGAWEESPLPGGALAVREVWRQAAARCLASGICPDRVKEMFPRYADRMELLHRQMLAGVNTPYSPSAGRLFDAVSALLGHAPERISYEGQAAVRLEAAARSGEASGDPAELYLAREKDGLLVIDWSPLFADAGEGRLPNARTFHEAVADAAVRMVEYALDCREHPDVKLPVILTGGVFQNRLLTTLTRERLACRGIQCFIPGTIPPNDGGISVGQILWSALQFRLSGVNYTV